MKKLTKKGEFERKVRKMKASQIIMAMVRGLRKPVTEIDMATYGVIRGKKCFGCAATNTICQIGGYQTKDLIEVGCSSINNEYKEIDRSALVNDGDFISDFESAINQLRMGNIDRYNIYGFARIKNPHDRELPHLYDDFRKDELDAYAKLAKDNAVIEKRKKPKK
jgi:hypothetical protein